MGTDHTATIKSILDAETSIPNVQIYDVPKDSEMEDRCVWMNASGDQQSPGQFFWGSETEDQKTVQVRSRGPRHDPAQAKADAIEIRDALKNNQPSGYMAVRLLNGENYLATDGDGRHEYSFNVLAWIIE